MTTVRRPGRGPVAGALAVVATAALVLAGCGAPGDGARAIDATAVPYELLSPAPEPTEPPVEPSADLSEPGDMPTQVYYLDTDDLLVPVELPTGSRSPADQVEELLERLAAGPDDDALEAGLASALGPDVLLSLDEIIRGIAYVEISTPAREPAADRLPLAVGQIVLTVTTVVGVSGVVLLTDGEEIQVPLPDGQRVPGPVTPEQYGDLLSTGPGS